jgi:tetratricopeptide (TPR) repeat protein
VLLWTLQARQLALWEPGEAVRRRAVGAELLELTAGPGSGRVMGAAQALSWQILDHLELGDMAVVRQALRRYRELSASCRLPRVRWHVTVVEAALAHLAGRLEDARRLARRAVTLLPPSRRNNVATFFGVQSFLIREEEGRLDEIASSVATAAEQAVNLPIWRAAMAVLHANLGRSDAARQIIGELAAAQFADLPRDGNLLGTYARLAEACSLAAATAFAEPLLQLLQPHAGAVVVLATTAGCLGSAARYAGLLAHQLGRLDEAVRSFEAALETNQRIGAVPQLAHTQRELARTLRARSAAGDRERANALDASARETATRLGLVTLGKRLDADDQAPAPKAGPASARPAVAALRTGVVRREGDFWTVSCGDERTRLKDTKGVAYLAELLRHPGHELHALDLGGASELRAGDAGEVLDADARSAYRARVAELGSELAEAEDYNDIGRVARIREEMEMLGGELARASGLGGRARKTGSDTERARLNVTRAVRKVVRKILDDCPLLGHHLDRSVKTGLFCGYEPDPAFPIDWQL